MRTLTKLVSRNLKVYFRDKIAIFFSMMTVVIMICLYILFLGTNGANVVIEQIGDIDGIRWLVDSWMMAGLLIISTFTVTLSVFGIMINDKVNHNIKGFLVSPTKRSVITLSYLITSWIAGILMTCIGFIIVEIYLCASGGEFVSMMSTIKILGLVVLSVICSSSIVFVFVTLINSQNGFVGFTTIIGTSLGFLMGIYVPLGILTETIQNAMKFFPLTYSCVLMRQIFLKEPLAKVFSNAPTKALLEYQELNGVILYINDTLLSPTFMIGTIIIFTLAMLMVCFWIMDRK